MGGIKRASPVYLSFSLRRGISDLDGQQGNAQKRKFKRQEIKSLKHVRVKFHV
jgi:hypothetical protein